MYFNSELKRDFFSYFCGLVLELLKKKFLNKSDSFCISYLTSTQATTNKQPSINHSQPFTVYFLSDFTLFEAHVPDAICSVVTLLPSWLLFLIEEKMISSKMEWQIYHTCQHKIPVPLVSWMPDKSPGVNVIVCSPLETGQLST